MISRDKISELCHLLVQAKQPSVLTILCLRAETLWAVIIFRFVSAQVVEGKSVGLKAGKISPRANDGLIGFPNESIAWWLLRFVNRVLRWCR